jgi:hypothetical protein
MEEALQLNRVVHEIGARPNASLRGCEEIDLGEQHGSLAPVLGAGEEP